MLPNKILIWILVGTLVVSLCVIMALSLSTAHYYHLTCNLRIELNQTSQTIKQLEQEEKQRIEIMERAQERLDRAEKVKNYQEARDIWQEVYRALSSPP